MDEHIELKVKELEEAIQQQKDFKKENKDVFELNRQHTKNVNKLKSEIRTQMVEQNLNLVVVGNIEIEIKKQNNSKHDLELLENIIDDSDKFKSYVEGVQTIADKVVARKAGSKRKREDNIQSQ